MPKRPSRKSPVSPPKTSSLDWLAKALEKQKKSDLVSVLIELARGDRGVRQQLEARFHVEIPDASLVADTRRAIADATDFDVREINHNFSYDYTAYDRVRRNFTRLVKEQQLRTAMDLALVLMKDGSYQVEMSDEGLMTDDIEKCLQVVVTAVGRSDLPAQDVIAWCDRMLKTDSVGCIFDRELKSLRGRFAEAASCDPGHSN